MVNDPEQFLSCSRELMSMELPPDIEPVRLELHLAQYSFFYDSSRRGHACTYCVLVRRAYDPVRTRDYLLNLRSQFVDYSHVPQISKNIKTIDRLLERV